MHGLLVWFNRDFWQPVWPNLAASALIATLAVLRVRAHLRKHHESLLGEFRKLTVEAMRHPQPAREVRQHDGDGKNQ